VASASDVAPVAPLAGVLQLLARAEPMLGCDRHLVVPHATEAGLLDDLNTRLPPKVKRLASWTCTGKVELPVDSEVRPQHWWSSRLIQVKAAVFLEAAAGRDFPRLEAQRAGKAGGWLSDPPVAGDGLCLTGAHYSTLLKWHLGSPLLPVDCAGRPCSICGGPAYVFGDHAVSCKKSGFGERHLDTQTFLFQVLTQSRVPHDRDVDIAGNLRRPEDILVRAWGGRRDLAVDRTIVQSNDIASRPLRVSAATFLKDKGVRKCRESADSCGRMGVDFFPMVFDTWGEPPRRRKVCGEGDVRPMQRPAPSQRPPSGGWCHETGPQCATGTLGGQAAGGLNNGVNGDTGMVVRRTPAHSRLHGGGQPTVVSRGQGKPSHCHTAGLPHLTSPHRALVLRLLP